MCTPPPSYLPHQYSSPKVELSDAVLEFVKKNTENYGKAKLCLQDSEAFIECDEPVKDEFYKDAEMCKYIIPNTAVCLTMTGATAHDNVDVSKWKFRINEQALPVRRFSFIPSNPVLILINTGSSEKVCRTRAPADGRVRLLQG